VLFFRLIPVFRLNPPCRKGPWTFWPRRCEKRAYWHFTKVRRVAPSFVTYPSLTDSDCKGMASPLVGIAGVNSLLFAAYGISKRIISPFGQLSLRRPPRRAPWLAPRTLFLPVRWKCSRCACRASTETRRTSGCASSRERCGRSGVSEGDHARVLGAPFVSAHG
jgi:hypothetical protein